jgi:hypothetical protein
LYVCETSLILRKEHTLRVLENSALSVELTGEWRKLHNEELHNLYYSPDNIRMIRSRRMRWAGHIACMREMRNAYKILVVKPEEKRPLGRIKHRF